MSQASDEYFSLTGAWVALSESARQHDTEAFTLASTFIDTRPTVILRGLGFMLERLSLLPDGEVPYREEKEAMRATAEIMALLAVMLEHQNNESLLGVLREHQEQIEQEPVAV